MAKLNLDLSKTELQRPQFDLVPEGEYEVEVVGAEVKDTRAGGNMLVVTLEILNGNMAGATIQDRLNIVNRSAEAQRIALERLKTIATFIGHPNPSKIADTDELLKKLPMKAKVKIEEKEDGGKVFKSNVISYYTAIPREEKTSTEKEAPANASASGKRPWSK